MEAVEDTLRTADPAVRCWTFLPAPSPLAFWARRQAHETAIHRADAQLAAGPVTPFAADFAAPTYATVEELCADPETFLCLARRLDHEGAVEPMRLADSPDGYQVVAAHRPLSGR